MSRKEELGVLDAAHRVLDDEGRAVLCQIVRTEGSTPGKLGWKLLVSPGEHSFGNLGGGAFEAMVKVDAKAMLEESDRESEVKRYYLTEEAVHGEATGMVCGGMAEVMLELLEPAPLLAVCGGGPVGQALATNAALCGFEVLVADDRPEFTDLAKFPEGTRVAEVSRDYAEDFLAELHGRDIFVAVVSRCWETDLAAVESIVRQRPPRLRYLGLMGSERKIQRILAELSTRERSVEDLPLHAPIGLPIGGESPAEIAVSIVAEMVEQRRGHQARSGSIAELKRA